MSYNEDDYIRDCQRDLVEAIGLKHLKYKQRKVKK